MEKKVINVDDIRPLEETIRNKVGNHFVFAYMDEDQNCHTYVSDKVTDMELCYFADTLNSRRYGD